MEFNINGTLVPQVEKYDNQGAHNAIKSMMQRKVHIPEHTRSLSGSLLGYKTIP